MSALSTASAPGRREPPSGNVPRERAKGRAVWEERPTLVGQFGKGVVLTVVVLAVVLPLYAIILTSFSSEGAITRAGGSLVVVPDGLSLSAYREIFSNGVVTRAVVVSVGITVVGTAVSMVLSILCAYGLSRVRSFGHRFFLGAMIFTMFFGGGLIPGFLVVTSLHGYDNYWALILPSCLSVFNILIMRGFYQATAQEMIDAARIDGAGEWRILWSVVLPTTKAVTAVMTLFYAVGYWGSWFNTLLYMPFDNNKWSLSYVLYEYVNLGAKMPGVGTAGAGDTVQHQVASPFGISMAVVVLTLIPILAVYPFLQKHFTKGMLTGAIKG
ncbi:binding-protein-dependent transport systems inner membrane component [Catenulispora acidiphila DSM 44928]|uniref:Binding-protein-dependent transport systems inner membrane component n=1 Tax=Catenulispora acidiphila (strain DSM 44928 / JCM 14897 / NBRC 102108 / NRRL B-24433 / ID139908) TaxID=479433 RepID=C7Q360_CATAD|nr:carbohydrate ABC transporter permease [Catenulispora acidiphila]ACU73796.1 binding-protein-dependent transport systems inner membrane component [Catenulispora acidiphila DSM 44928]